jgi:broad specificity phosphatase PhoE
VSRLYLVRHGRAAAGWDTDLDPGLDEIGRRQAADVAAVLVPLGPLAVVSSPLQRCRQTADPLAAAWGADVRVEPRVAEIPSPAGVAMGERIEWLRTAMAGCWTDLGASYVSFRDSVVAAVVELVADTVVFSHFIAINAVIGAATGDDRLVIRALDNCSVTVIDVISGGLRLVEGGREADTLIR